MLVGWRGSKGARYKLPPFLSLSFPPPTTLFPASLPSDPFHGGDGYTNPRGEQILGHENLINTGPSRAFLLDKTQHIVGGFGKHPGSPPDAYHSFLGLAALATMGDEELGGFDAALCAPESVVRRIEEGRAQLLRRQ